MYLFPIYITIYSFIISLLVGRFISKWSIFFNIFCILLALLVSFAIFYEVCLLHITCHLHIFKWIANYNININWSILYDPLSTIMCIIILFVSLCANIYSVEYMSNDPHKIRFFSYLSLFTFTMLFLVTSNNIIQLFFGWETVGLTSYLLINFWYTRIQANKSSILAIMANKLGDIALLISSILFVLTYKSVYFYNASFITDIYDITYSFDYSNIGGYILTNFTNDLYIVSKHISFNINTIQIYTFLPNSICLLIILAAICKSAQFGFHFWLAEAMEGPTPVSSLLHAATMVTAGIFLLIRCSFLFDFSIKLPIFIIFIGSFTAFISSLIGATQYDLKKIIAYSTCSQLGYMFLSNGLFSYNFTMFHLFNHAFFKALLFLSAGYIIHFLSNEQDLRKMGSLLKIAPLPYICITIGSFSLMGLPYMSGFFSKDAIIEIFYNLHNNCNLKFYNIIFFSQILLSISISITIFYSIKIIYYIFINSYNGFSQYLSKIHFPKIFIILPLLLLSILSLNSGFIFSDMMIGLSNVFWSNSINLYHIDNFELNDNLYSISNVDLFYSTIPREFNKFIYYYIYFNTIYITILSIFFYFIFNKYIYILTSGFNKWYYFYIVQFNRKLLFFHRIFITLSLNFIFREAYIHIYKLLDKNIFEILGPFGIIHNLKYILKKIDLLSKDLIYHYGGIFILVLIYLICNFFFIINA